MLRFTGGLDAVAVCLDRAPHEQVGEVVVDGYAEDAGDASIDFVERNAGGLDLLLNVSQDVFVHAVHRCSLLLVGLLVAPAIAGSGRRSRQARTRADSSGAARGGAGGAGRSPAACGTGSAPAASAAARARSSGCSGDRRWVATAHAMSCARASGAERRLSPGVGVVVPASASVNPWSSSAADTAAAQASARRLCSRSARSASAAAAAWAARRCSRAWARRLLVEQVIGDRCRHAEVEQSPAQPRIDGARDLLLLFLLGSNNNISL